MARGYRKKGYRGAKYSRYKSRWSKEQKYWRRQYKLNKLNDAKINHPIEKAIVRIHKKLDQDETWQTSRVEHFASNQTFPSSHARPTFNQMVELQANTIWFHDLTQLPTDSTDNLQECKVGKYQIKTIQSRLRFYSKNLHENQNVTSTCIRVALIKINNSGKLSLLAGGSNYNIDIWPNETMMADTNLQFSGIHKKDLKKTVSAGSQGGGTFGAVTIAQKKFWLGPNRPTNGGKSGGSNSDNTTASTVKEIILTKSYKTPLVHYQVSQDTTVDSVLSQAQNKSKIIGDRIWLCILSDQQLDFAFYGVSGCIYNYSEIEGLPSVPLPEAAEIIGGQQN